MRWRTRATLCLAAAACACGGPAATTTNREASTAAPEPVPYGLYALPVIGGSETPPADYMRGKASFELGKAAYEAKRYDEAAEEFLDAGLTFQVPLGTPYSRELMNMSELSCRNAALAWKTIHEIDKVSIVYGDVKSSYPACASGLQLEMPTPPKF